MIMSAKALLDRNPKPSEADVREALAANLCRCGTHNRIVRASCAPPTRWGGRDMNVSLSRRDFVKGLRRHRARLHARSRGGAATAARRCPAASSNNRTLDAWIRINADGTATVFTGKVELGQGILTALAQIAAEELDLPLDAHRR